MQKKYILKLIPVIMIILMGYLPVNAYEYENEDYYEEETVQTGDYCSPKTGIKEKIKRAFVGTPTGFTPQIQPSPYLNPNFGPSYMQGYYSGNNWTSHNFYNPVNQLRLFGKSF